MCRNKTYYPALHVGHNCTKILHVRGNISNKPRVGISYDMSGLVYNY